MSNPFRQSKSSSKPHQSRSNKHSTRHSASKRSTPRSGDAHYDPGLQDPAYGYGNSHEQTGEYYDEQYAFGQQQYDQPGYVDPQADYRHSQRLSAPVANGHDRRHRHKHDVYCDPQNQLPQNADY